VVTGLDVIPATVNYLQKLPTDPDMEWWSPGQVTSWLDTVLWVPHHLASLVCGVFGFLLVWMSAAWGWRQKEVCGVGGAEYGAARGCSGSGYTNRQGCRGAIRYAAAGEFLQFCAAS
jgi:hypothetical protein